MDNETGYINQAFGEFSMKIRDLEERQRVMKDRVLLIGKNLVETREKTNEGLLELKKENMLLKQDMKRLVGFLEAASAELGKFARKEDIEILYKQAGIFKNIRQAKNKK